MPSLHDFLPAALPPRMPCSSLLGFLAKIGLISHTQIQGYHLQAAFPRTTLSLVTSLLLCYTVITVIPCLCPLRETVVHRRCSVNVCCAELEGQGQSCKNIWLDGRGRDGKELFHGGPPERTERWSLDKGHGDFLECSPSTFSSSSCLSFSMEPHLTILKLARVFPGPCLQSLSHGWIHFAPTTALRGGRGWSSRLHFTDTDTGSGMERLAQGHSQFTVL